MNLHCNVRSRSTSEYIDILDSLYNIYIQCTCQYRPICDYFVFINNTIQYMYNTKYFIPPYKNNVHRIVME